MCHRSASTEWRCFHSFYRNVRHLRRSFSITSAFILKQQLELGLVIFYVWYFLEYLIRFVQFRNHYLAYIHISFEKEAYAHERDLGYLRKRRFCAWWKYL